ncbi:MAG: HPr family phosphocarrier protein [Butyrivibrio sp.]|nr:HPr family phosphocarrier protein [Butyrivibrio sp.]
MLKKSIEVKLSNGLDARPVAELVQIATKYDSSVHIEYQDKKVNAKSIMGMMTLSVGMGESVTVIAEGKDEAGAVDEMEKYLSCAE